MRAPGSFAESGPAGSLISASNNGSYSADLSFGANVPITLEGSLTVSGYFPTLTGLTIVDSSRILPLKRRLVMPGSTRFSPNVTSAGASIRVGTW